MKKVVTMVFLTLVIMLSLCFAVTPAFAGGGDEHRNSHQGDIGQGAVEQHQNRINQ